jgi:hypothetical protein
MESSMQLRKRQKTEHVDPGTLLETAPAEKREVRIKFVDTEGQEIGDEIQVDAGSTSKIDLNKILDQIMQPEEKQVYQFYLDDMEVRGSISELLEKMQA